MGVTRGPFGRQWIAFPIMLIMFSSLTPAVAAGHPDSLSLKVSSDGYVSIDQSISSNSSKTSVQVRLLSPIVSDFMATDQNGFPLSYEFSKGGANVTVYTLGATLVNLAYDTDALTSKNGSVWTLQFQSESNSSVILPQYSILSDVSGTPYSINQTDSSPELGLSAGRWSMSYGLPLGTSSTTTGTVSPGNTETITQGRGYNSSLQLSPLEWVGIALVIVVIGTLVFAQWRRTRGPGAEISGLRPDDVQVLNFIREKGGKVLEPEIRMKFALPKTSAWRQIKRLERLGYVRVTKIGSQNQIEILKGP
jgi:uncharacterized membrane protein